MTLASVKKMEARLLLSTYDRYPVLLEKGKGVYLYSADGTRYLDFLAGIAVNALGYAHPAITRAIAWQAGKLIHTSNLFYHPYQSELARKLTRISGMDRAFFTNSGTEAFEGALKIARAYAKQRAKGGKKRWRVLAMQDSFHGRTVGSLSATWTKKYRKPFGPLLAGVEFIPFNDASALKKALDGSFCVVAIETVQGEGGIRPATREFLHAARALTRKTGALLLLDEIQSGLGRTGKYFAYQHYGVRPDLLTVAKPLAGGLPLGAALVTEEVAKAITPGMHGTTFGGGPLACAAALAFLEVLEKDKLVAHSQQMGGYLHAKLRELKQRHRCIGEVRGLGLMAGIELDTADRAKAAVKAMLDEGVIINRTHDTVLRLLPPLIIQRSHIDTAVKALDRVLTVSEKSEPHSTRASGRSKR